jgi:DNA-binding NarL/FixJ family response regulator
MDGYVLHARQDPKRNELVFRAWSTGSDSYISKEMSEPEMREWILKVAICDVIERHFRQIDESIERTIKNGTSSLLGGDSRPLSSPWKKSVDERRREEEEE